MSDKLRTAQGQGDDDGNKQSNWIPEDLGRSQDCRYEIRETVM